MKIILIWGYQARLVKMLSISLLLALTLMIVFVGYVIAAPYFIRVNLDTSVDRLDAHFSNSRRATPQYFEM